MAGRLLAMVETRRKKKAASNTNPPPPPPAKKVRNKVTSPVARAKPSIDYSSDEFAYKDEEDEDTKMSPKTAAAAKDALAEPQDKPAAAGKGKKKRSWKKPEVSG